MKPTKLEELKKSLPKSARSYKSIKLAKKVASSPEKEWFTIEKK